jgi:hypothetical protein
MPKDLCPRTQVPGLEGRKQIRWTDDLERNIIGYDDIVEFPTFSLEVGGLFSCLSFVVEPPVLVLDIRHDEGLESGLKGSLSVRNDLLGQSQS